MGLAAVRVRTYAESIIIAIVTIGLRLTALVHSIGCWYAFKPYQRHYNSGDIYQIHMLFAKHTAGGGEQGNRISSAQSSRDSVGRFVIAEMRSAVRLNA